MDGYEAFCREAASHYGDYLDIFARELAFDERTAKVLMQIGLTYKEAWSLIAS